MIDIKLLEKKAEGGPSYYDEYKQTLLNRGASVDALDLVMSQNKKRKELMTQAETAKANQNKVSGEIAQLKKAGKDATSLIEEMGKLAVSVREMEQTAAEAEIEVTNILLTLPNKLRPEVPVGKSENDNKEVKTVGEAKKLPFKAMEHWEIGEKLGILDFERAGKVTGARFTFLKGAAAQLERALIQFFMDLHSEKHGYTEMIPPFIVNTASCVGTGQFPKFVDDVFHLTGTDYHLIPTAEVPVTNYYANEILKEEDLPQKFCAYSPCFRSEAGSHGRDTKGLIRQHQFNKVELMVFAHPSQSDELHEQLTSHAEQVLLDLELPFRRMLLCSGDIGFGAAKCYDLEVWLPGAGSYREISSCSNFEDFQARRANIRFRPNGGKPQFVHTLNGSGLAVGRTLIAVLENYQQEDGSVLIPKALQPYMNGKTKIS
ncbi:MAG: serine--tRNA ligase [Bdellovibrio sp. CG10_big_fil_rev_8_21_14_0_10_47_8]|nr:MAG: serine--tRNA ligase [Bdellovibrio sp. CG10_big_fil_rev_8_21_14_0_10_47_8]